MFLALFFHLLQFFHCPVSRFSALKLPVVVEKNGQRYSLDIATDADGTDLVIQKEEEVQS